ncbi:extracellular solute-binding protein [Clostridium chromiireducens]|uniref:Extracellular solute-binding protein n=1 Tax=Clostridium chromiireducens TaxID=225345 RepID=A0A399IWJ7_9CLOT|nr:extracellular solute-binding protein [Clostridium chromiireducens]MVX63951.1 extracellular solute-binding protein [Clostridium chromiireducens]RII36599.1 extracellular solute-binding protein [Clostridium chromiireducens]
MIKRVKKIMTAALVTAMTFSLAACSSNKSADNSSGESGPIKLTMWHQSVGDTDPTAKLLVEAVDQWNKDHPNIIVEQDGVTGEQYKTKIKTALAADEAPDIEYMWGGSFVGPYIEAGNMLPIDQYITPEIKDKLIKGTIDGCVVKGKTYSLPMYTFIASLYCNKELFDKAGAKIPTTYDELLDAVKKLRAANITPIALGEKDRWPGMYWFDIMAMRQAGNSAVMAAMKDPSKFKSPEFVAAAKKMQELADAGAFNDSMFSMSYDEMLGAFTGGNSAMMFQANWVTSPIDDPSAATSGKVVAVPFPLFKDGAGKITEFYGGGVDGFYVNANTKHPKEAVEFLSYLSEKIGKEGYLANAGLACWDTKDLDTSKLSPLTKQAADLMATGTSYVTWWDNILPATSAETHKNAIAELLGKKITPEQFCDEMSKVESAK